MYSLHYEKFQDGTVKCIEDEIPFEVPEGWEWSRANCISDVRDGTHDTPAYVEKGVPLITSKNLTSAGVDYSNVKYISVEDATQINQRSGVDVGDILFAMIGTIGNPKLVTENTLISIKNVALFKFSYNSDLSHHYILRVLEYLQEQMKENPSGGLQPFVSLNRLRTTLLPIAPITEQNRIVEKLENLLRKVDLINYDCDELDTLIKAVKSKILDLAIRGQLVPQDPNDEPASVLLERIRAEKEELIKAGKIKRDKKESIIFRGEDNSYYEKIDDEVHCIDEELPFEIPKTWEWVRLQNCCTKEIRRGKSPKYTEQSNTLVFAQKCNTKYAGIDTGLALYLDESTLSKYSDDEYMQDGDIVVNSTGTGTLGRIGFYRNYGNDVMLPIVPDSHVTVIRACSSIQKFYLYIFMKANQHKLEKQGEGSTNQKELKPLTLKNMLVPIPPYSEQERISAVITSAFSITSAIRRSLS